MARKIINVGSIKCLGTDTLSERTHPSFHAGSSYIDLVPYVSGTRRTLRTGTGYMTIANLPVEDSFYDDNQNENHIMYLQGVSGIICSSSNNFTTSWAEWGRLYFTIKDGLYTIRYQSKDTDSNNRKIAIGIYDIDTVKLNFGLFSSNLAYHSISAVFDENPTAFTGYFNPPVGTVLNNCPLGTFGVNFNGDSVNENTVSLYVNFSIV
jgi:hypothetical protein